MQKERGVFFGQRTNLGSAPTPSEERKKSLLRAPHFVRIPTSKFHTVESWIPSTRTVARSLFTRTTIDKPPPPSEKKEKEANTEKFAFLWLCFSVETYGARLHRRPCDIPDKKKYVTPYGSREPPCEQRPSRDASFDLSVVRN